MTLPPVIAIDGPSGSGKGAVSERVAARLRWHYLDSGAIYRALAYVADKAGVAASAEASLAVLARDLDLRFTPGTDGGEGRIWVNGDDATGAIRTEHCGNRASQIAALAAVRAALLQKQRDFRQAPGLVADGRDMGTTLFPDAQLKIFLTASAQARAERRYKQLKEKGFDVNLPRLLGEIRERDARDAARVASPLTPAADAYILDTSELTLSEVVEHILGRLPQGLAHDLQNST